MAMVIPVRVSRPERGAQVFIVVLNKENLDRMKEADPFDLQMKAYRQVVDTDQKLVNLDLVIAYEEDTAELERMAKAGDIAGLIAYIERGRVIKSGDTMPPVSLKNRE
jgi:hypothetical protein